MDKDTGGMTTSQACCTVIASLWPDRLCAMVLSDECYPFCVCHTRLGFRPPEGSATPREWQCGSAVNGLGSGDGAPFESRTLALVL